MSQPLNTRAVTRRDSAPAGSSIASLATRRTSLRRQILFASLLPLFAMGSLLAVYNTVNTLSTVMEQLHARGLSVAGVTAEAVYEDLEKVSNPIFRADLNATAAFNLRAIQDGAFVAIASNDGIVAISARPGLGSKPVQEALERQTDAKTLAVGSERFVVAMRGVQKFDGTGSLGRVYIGLETGTVAAQVRGTLIPTLLLLLAALGAAALLASWFAGRVTRPILEATNAANRISLGDLEASVRPGNNDEIGDLMRALERMRFSLKFMIERTRRK